ncbi:MAG: hypothetical protein SH856_07895 [Flavobacteriales bacterium]|nr:hypothetical protein [Flavobacteriales bacterium]
MPSLYPLYQYNETISALMEMLADMSIELKLQARLLAAETDLKEKVDMAMMEENTRYVINPTELATCTNSQLLTTMECAADIDALLKHLNTYWRETPEGKN